MAEAAAAAAPRIAETLAEGSAERREAAYAEVETAARSALSLSGAARDEPAALAFGSVRPIIEAVLLAPDSKIGQAECTRASLLLYEIAKIDLLKMNVQLNRADADGVPLFVTTWTSETNVFAAILRKEPSEWTREDAITVALNHGLWHIVLWAAGSTSVTVALGLTTDEQELGFYHAWSTRCPFVLDKPQPEDRYLPLARLCMDLVRSEIDTQPDGVIACAATHVCMSSWYRPSLGRALWDDGFLDVYQATLRRYNPLERISKRDLIPSAVLSAMKDISEGAQRTGVDVVQPLVDTGAVELAISTLTAYQMLGKPEDASVCGVWWGALFTLDLLLGSPMAKPITEKMRSAGVDSVRYLLDHPLVQVDALGMETGVTATRIAALVWGRDDDGGGLGFLQRDIDKVVKVTGHRDAAISHFFPLTEGYGKAILNLAVSECVIILASSYRI